mmetsp:Transcript_38/g.104  ORF Transcript_38/g.104 Transcript_38/m.104 type:complete len:120 (+) Transcript_38:1132-1491(+)
MRDIMEAPVKDFVILPQAYLSEVLEGLDPTRPPATLTLPSEPLIDKLMLQLYLLLTLVTISCKGALMAVQSMPDGEAVEHSVQTQTSKTKSCGVAAITACVQRAKLLLPAACRPFKPMA